MTFPNGEYYEGSWVNGEMSGEGTYKWYEIVLLNTSGLVENSSKDFGLII